MPKQKHQTELDLCRKVVKTSWYKLAKGKNDQEIEKMCDNNIDRATIGAYKRGEMLPSFVACAFLRRATGVSIDEWLDEILKELPITTTPVGEVKNAE